MVLIFSSCLNRSSLMIWMEGGQTWVTTKAGALRSTGKGAAWPPHMPPSSHRGPISTPTWCKTDRAGLLQYSPMGGGRVLPSALYQDPQASSLSLQSLLPQTGAAGHLPPSQAHIPIPPRDTSSSLSREIPFFQLQALPARSLPRPISPTFSFPLPRTFRGCFQHSPVPAPSSFTPGTTFPLGLAPSHSTLNELPGSKCPIGTVYPALGTVGLGEYLARVHACVSVPAVQGFASLSFLLL